MHPIHNRFDIKNPIKQTHAHVTAMLSNFYSIFNIISEKLKVNLAQLKNSNWINFNKWKTKDKSIITPEFYLHFGHNPQNF